ncbi:MAG: TLD-domain-containing protein, partial [Piptocephalis tieghemiana]
LSLVGRRVETPAILNLSLARSLRSKLPALQRTATHWQLAYSLDQHGISLSSLYRQVERKGPCILVVSDEANHVFGAFLSDPPHPQPGYFGSGECFLWRAIPSPEGSEVEEVVESFPWTGVNDYCILAEPHFLAVGGGNGRFGLWVDEYLEKGHTSACPTFGNPELVPGQEGYGTFVCEGLEVWTF